MLMAEFATAVKYKLPLKVVVIKNNTLGQIKWEQMVFLGNPEYGGVYETIAGEMRAGDVLIWDGSLWHGGGANTTGQRRMGMAMNYCAGFIRQQENQQLGLTPERVRAFSPRPAVCDSSSTRRMEVFAK